MTKKQLEKSEREVRGEYKKPIFFIGDYTKQLF